MKWNLPEASERRVRKAFAIVPKNMNLEATRVWLEEYYVGEQYSAHRKSWVQIVTSTNKSDVDAWLTDTEEDIW